MIFRHWQKPILAFGAVILIVLGVSACGQPTPPPSVTPAPVNQPAVPPSVTPAPINQPPPKVAPQVPGFGPVTIRIMGTAVKQGAGAIYTGDCDDMYPHDDDFEVMTFSAPWPIVGRDQGGNSAAMGGPIDRAFLFEKNSAAAKVRLKLHFGLERSNATVAMLTAGHPKVADITFANSTVGLFRVRQTRDLETGYAALFPIVQQEGMPAEREFTGRYIATVQLISGSLPAFNGWSQAEIIKLFDSFYTERCLGAGLERALAPFAPTMIYE